MNQYFCLVISFLTKKKLEIGKTKPIIVVSTFKTDIKNVESLLLFSSYILIKTTHANE